MSSNIIILNTIVDINGIKSVIVCTGIRQVVVHNICTITDQNTVNDTMAKHDELMRQFDIKISRS